MAYYHVVFTVPAELADIAYQNKAVVYDILFKAASQTLLTIAADPKHLGARIGVTAVLHSWGSAMTHHPHLHCIVPGGGLSGGRPELGVMPPALLPAGAGALAPVPAAVPGQARRRPPGRPSRLLRRPSLAWLTAPPSPPAWPRCAAASGSSIAKRPFAGPEAVLAYLARYTHRVAISSSRLVSLDERGVTFGWKDYRAKGVARRKLMTLDAAEFIRRFLIHVLPGGFHRIRHYGLFANAARHRPTSPRSAPCCNRSRRRQPLRTTPHRPYRSRLERARAAAAACSSSRPSSVASHLGSRPSGRCSGSTPHDPHSPELIRHHGPCKAGPRPPRRALASDQAP